MLRTWRAVAGDADDGTGRDTPAPPTAHHTHSHSPHPIPHAHAQVMLTTGRAGAVLTEDYFAAENRLVHRLLDSQAENMHII